MPEQIIMTFLHPFSVYVIFRVTTKIRSILLIDVVPNIHTEKRKEKKSEGNATIF